MTVSDDLARFEAVMARRRSNRAFLPQPVAPAVLRRVLDATLRTPSNCNTQPWFVHVVAGEELVMLRERMTQAAMAGQIPDHDVPEPFAYAGPYRTRQIDAAVQLFNAQGITRQDIAGRQRSMLRNYQFFHAPHIALFCLPEGSGAREAADCGQCMQSFMLALTAAGLASCPQGALGGYSAITHDTLGIPAEQRILAGISFGYADETHPTAQVRVGRAPIEELVTFHGWRGDKMGAPA